MIARTQHQRARLLTSLRQGVVAFSAVYLLIAGVLGLQIVVRNGRASESEHQVLVAQQQVANTKAEIDKAKSLALVSEPSDLSALGRLQVALDSLAKEQNCTVSEFRASSEILPYLTRFAKTTSVSGWGQVEIQVDLAGKIQNVIATLSGLLKKDVPFEFDSLKITRDKIDSVGDATVVAHATMRVLIRTSKDGS